MDKVLGVSEFQVMVDDWIKSVSGGYFPPTTNLCMLAEEVGEVSRLISRAYGEQRFKPGEKPTDIKTAIADELSDVIFIAVCIANEQGIDLNQALLKNMDKKTIRDKLRYV